MNRHECTPAIITSEIKNFSLLLVDKPQLKFIDVKPHPHSKMNECFHNVDYVVKESGGKRILGRIIWQWANILVEGEAHAIWESPDGKLIDVTPNNYNENRILFLEDPGMVYRNMVIGSIRIPLTDSPDVKELIHICEEMDAIMRDTRGKEVSIPVNLVRRRSELTLQMNKPAGRNDPCPCGSKMKFKRCCGR